MGVVGSGCAVVQSLGADQTAQCDGAQCGGAVIGAAGGQRECFAGDVGRKARLLHQRVVARIGAAEGVAAYGDYFCGADVLVGKAACCCAAQRDHVRQQRGNRSRAASAATVPPS